MAKPYAIVAQLKDNPDRSNYLGKSSIPEAIDFCLFDRLNPDRHMTADGWITDGEKTGSVSLTLDTGDRLTRSRKIGRSTQFTFNDAKGVDAQRLLIEALGMSADDFLATAYFQQRQMARLVLAPPRVRMEYVSEWFRLAPLEKGEELLWSALTAKGYAATVARDRLAQLKELEAHELGDDTAAAVRMGLSSSLESVVQQADEVHKQLTTTKDRLVRFQSLLERNRTYAEAPVLIAEYERREQEWVDLKTVADETRKFAVPDLAQLRKQSQETSTACSIATKERDQKQKLAAGHFDGHCPVAHIECPATYEINAQRQRNNELLEASEVVLKSAQREMGKARDAADSAEALYEKIRIARMKEERAGEWLIANVSKYEDAKQHPPAMDPEELRTRLQDTQREVSDLTLKLAALQRSITVVTEVRHECARKAAEIAALEKDITTHREALAIFGKQGAQRRVAERALGVIQNDANEMLAESGITLDVTMSWSREGQQPAKTCDACGSPFPSSAKVKACERCGAERGLQLINKLDIILSDQSGAAEDLAGAAVQFAASSWLRAHRGVRWTSALVDEPFAFCDRANRRALSMYLARVLMRPGGFDQAFVISHTGDTDVFPGRIEITSDGKNSKVQVVA